MHHVLLNSQYWRQSVNSFWSRTFRRNARQNPDGCVWTVCGVALQVKNVLQFWKLIFAAAAVTDSMRPHIREFLRVHL